MQIKNNANSQNNKQIRINPNWEYQKCQNGNKLVSTGKRDVFYGLNGS